MKDLGEALAANKKTTEAEVLRQDLECEDNYFTDHIDRSFSALKKTSWENTSSIENMGSCIHIYRVF